MTTVAAKGHIVVTMLMFAFGCGGIVVVDHRGDDAGDIEDGGGLSGHDGLPSDEGGNNTSTEEGWTTSQSPECVNDCGAWIGKCDNDKICVEPDAACPGREAERIQDLVACVCAGCAERCGGSCVMFDTANSECLECQQTMVRQTCSYEYYECVGF